MSSQRANQEFAPDEMGAGLVAKQQFKTAYVSSRVRSVELVPFATFPLYPHEPT
jgi:hypothetical protein